MPEPAEANSVQCVRCGELVFDYETATDGSIICSDCATEIKPEEESNEDNT